MNTFVKKWGEHIIRSWQYAAGLALAVAFLSFFNLPIGWLSSVVIALVTLQNGPKHGAIVLSWAVLPAVAMLYLGQFAVSINVIFLHYLLVWSFAVVLRQYNSWTILLQISACFGVLGVIIIYYAFPELTNTMVSQLHLIAKQYKEMAVFKTNDIDLVIKYLNQLVIGLLALAIILVNLTTLFVARWWQSMLLQSVSLQKECYRLRMHYATSLTLIALSLGLFMNNALFINILVVALMPFVICGLSLFHSYSSSKKNGHIFIVIFYALFICLSPYVVTFLSVLGWFDSFLNFRKKIPFNQAVEDKLPVDI